MALGLAIRALRTGSLMTQEDLGEAAGVHYTYISYIESGRRNITWTALLKISDALGVTASELVRMAEEDQRK